jgi:tRNA-2-methylthio-N6-dimethylallyladenosine synthase
MKSANFKYYLKTYGCQMNVHDSEKIAGIFSEHGYNNTESVKDASIVILNTCNIRQKAEQKFYSELGRLEKIKKNRPELKIAVAGCIAQHKGGGLFKRFPYVDFVFGPGNIDSLEKWINPVPYGTGQSPESYGTGQSPESYGTGQSPESYGTGRSPESYGTGRSPESYGTGQAVALADNPEYHLKTLPVKREGRVKAWVSIMYGCDNFCAYCVVPYTRGRERSRPVSDILAEVTNLAEQGYKEITLLGQNVNSYGKKLDERTTFPQLLKVLHEVKGIERIRFVTSHPRDFSEDLITTMRDLPKVCKHLHLPMQAGSDKVLKCMNRGYTYHEYKEKIRMVREAIPGIAVTTDAIVGFPGETEDDFEKTVSALKEIEFDGIFAFKYSKRPDTTALSLPHHVDEQLKSERLTAVLNLQDDITFKKNKLLVGEILEVMVEGTSETDVDKLTGRTRTNKIVNFYGNPEDIGKLLDVKILEAKRHSLLGERI